MIGEIRRSAPQFLAVRKNVPQCFAKAHNDVAVVLLHDNISLLYIL